jgi:hypothetical protein
MARAANSTGFVKSIHFSGVTFFTCHKSRCSARKVLRQHGKDLKTLIKQTGCGVWQQIGTRAI